MKASCYYHLNEVPRPHSRIKATDYCFIAVRGNRRKIYLLKIPVFTIQRDLFYNQIIFN